MIYALIIGCASFVALILCIAIMAKREDQQIEEIFAAEAEASRFVTRVEYGEFKSTIGELK